MRPEIEPQLQILETPNQEQQEKHTEQQMAEQTWKIARQRAALRWWVGTVILTLFPTATTVFMAVLRGHPPITLEFVLNDGELILASFLIVTSTSISANAIKNETILTDAIRYILYFLAAVQLIAYTVIKTNEANHPVTVAVVSFGALIVSICFSWIWYILTNEEV